MKTSAQIETQISRIFTNDRRTKIGVNSRNAFLKSQAAFTLIEILVVIAIIVVLAALLIPAGDRRGQ